MSRTRIRGTLSVVALALPLGVGAGFPVAAATRQSAAVAVFAPIGRATPAELVAASKVMAERLHSLGVALPAIAVRSSTIDVSLAVLPNPATDLAVLGARGELYFRPVVCAAPAYTGRLPKAGANVPAPPMCAANYSYLVPAPFNSNSGSVTTPPIDPLYASYPTTPPVQDESAARDNVILPSGSHSPARYVLGPAVVNGQVISGAIIKHAYSRNNPATTQWTVIFDMTAAGSRLFNAMATKYYGRQVADDLDGSLFSVPIIQSKEFPASGQISGNFSQQSANDLATELNSGPLPIQLRLASRTS